MRAVQASFLKFLRQSQQFAIPLYQRTYSWTERECSQLWDDILRTGSDARISGHFIGSVVYIQSGLYQVSSHAPLLVIDGQQRLTTVSLILEALALHLGDSEPIDGFSATKLRSYYLLNQLESGERRFKLLLTQTDKDSLLALVQQRPQPTEHSLRLEKNFEFFKGRIAALGQDLASLCNGLEKLTIVDISLDREHDNPQLIFESMNSTGRELSQADLIRNYVLMGLELSRQTQLYEDHWRPMELAFGQEDYGKRFDNFMRHYLTLKTGDIPNVGRVYQAFKDHAQSLPIAASGVDALVSDLHTYAKHYCAMALGRESDGELGEAFQDLRELNVDVLYPFLLELYQDYTCGILPKAEFVVAVRLIESYVFRRAACSIPTNSHNKTFATLGRALNKDRYLESIKAQLLLMPSYRRFPGDEEFKREFTTRDLYNFRNRSYWLRRLENHDRKERVSVDEYTIEHILPQNKNLSAQWRDDLGPAWEQVQEKWLHTLGNLTLTGYNTEYSDRPFAEKRDMESGFRMSPIKLNGGLGAVKTWDEAAISDRAYRLAAIAVGVWGRPTLPAGVLDTHRTEPERSKAHSYSIEDHPNLAPDTTVRGLFEAFRTAVLAIDPCISEEFLKVYVAYKAETNFVDVVPQAGRLRLSLNMRFHELHDPKGLGVDVTNVGRWGWGNGDVEVRVSSHEELPYVMGLVRQAFERQMDYGEAED